jgi:hypothetical protein
VGVGADAVTEDPQKTKLYAWEDSFWGWNFNLVKLSKCREVIRFAAHLYGIKPPSVRSHHKVSMSWSIPQSREISLQSKGSNAVKGGLNYPTALHEVTHQIIWDYYGASVQDHGPEFVGVYIWLLAQAGIAPYEALTASLRQAGIEFKLQDPKVMPSKTAPARLVVGAADPGLLLR